MGPYVQARDEAIGDPGSFWLRESTRIDWIEPPTVALDASQAPLYRWFPDGVLNTSANALDRHVASGRGEHVAIRYDSPVVGTARAITYAELLDDVARFADVLASVGVGYGDRVIIYMPMIPEAVVAMLACARLGAVHSVVFGGFAPAELAVRIDDATPRAVVTASCGIEPSRVIAYKPLLDEALRLAHHEPAATILLQRPQARADMGDRDVDWEQAMSAAVPRAAVPVRATDPLYILYTSGTTGKPKGVVRDNGGHAVAMAWSFDAVYGMGPDDVWWAASDVGWVVGHSYIVYAPLIAGATTVLYEGKPVGTPDAGAFWRVISDYGVSALFTAPTAIRAIKKEDPEGSPAGALRPDVTAHPLPGGRAARSGHLPLGDRPPRHPGHRQLVADGDRAGRSPPTCAASSRCRSSPAPRASPCPGTTSASSTGRARSCRPGTTERS